MRWIIAALAIAVLALAVIPLLRGPQDAALGVSEGRAPSPQKSAAAVVAADAGPAIRRPEKTDPVADTITTIVIDIARAKTSKADRKAMRERLVATMQAEGLGDESGRNASAEVAVRSIFKRAEQARAAGKPLGDLKLRVVKALSREFAAEIRERLPEGAKAKHSGAMRALAPEPAVPAGYTKVSWKLLSGFDYVEGAALPAPVKQIDARRVGVTGYMISLAETEAGIREFLLVQSLWDCCFGMPPDLHQGIVVTYSKPGLEFSSRAVQVLGPIQVGEDKDGGGTVLSVYRLKADSVRLLD